MDYRHAVKEATKAVENCAIGELLSQPWNEVQWSVSQDMAAKEPARAAAGQNAIHLYPPLLADKAPVRALVREFGLLLLAKADDNGKSIWDKKLDVPTDEAINKAATKLADEAIRSKCQQYRDVLAYYPDRGHSVDRLVFINIANALLANNIAYKNSFGVDIKTWGPTVEYCAKKKYHSLIPLVSAYAPTEVANDFGMALANLVENGLNLVRDKSVGIALCGIVQRVARLAVPAE